MFRQIDPAFASLFGGGRFATPFSVLAALLWVSPVAADPVTAGSWSPIPALSHNGTPWFDRTSADCYTCSVGYHVPAGAEYLHGQDGQAVGFGFQGWRDASVVAAVSDYAVDGTFSYDGVSFFYDNGHGFTSSSWQRTHMALFRLVETSRTIYWLGIEDLPASARGIDWDYNDLILRMVVGTEPLTRIVPTVSPSPMPEPGAFLLVVTGLGIGVRYTRAIGAAALRTIPKPGDSAAVRRAV